MDITHGNLNTVAQKHIAAYCDNRIALIDDLHILNYTNANTIRVEFIMSALCIKGIASLYVNGEAYTMNQYDLLICHPNIILEKSTVSADVQFRCICISPEYINQLVLISKNSWDILKYLEQNPILTLNPKEADMFCQYYDLLHSKLTGTPLRHQKEIIDSLMQSFLYEFHDTMERFGKYMAPTYSSSERLFKEFLNLLTSLYPKPRMVAAYADRLHVTPKYLSAVCKEISGQTASDLINNYVIKDVLYLLKKSEKSIKEIVNELDFPNLSFFGKYVKRYTGFSPKQYRKQLAEKETK